jgi:endonuclease/exonuclease/phosphatase family metal-dependent hydrolase
MHVAMRVGLLSMALLSASPAGARTDQVRLLTYNLFARPYVVGQDGQRERLQQLPDALACLQVEHGDIDVLVFAEAFIDSARRRLLDDLAARGWPYATRVLTDPKPWHSLLNGGVIIVSRWPIERQARMVYRHGCAHVDCIVAKGVVYARVLKTTPGGPLPVNVFATHMQAGSGDRERGIRAAHAHQIADFVAAQRLGADEPTFFLGDLNMEPGDELDHLLGVTDFAAPPRVGPEALTIDPRRNGLVGRDGGAGACKAEYARTGFCPCCAEKWLDYTLFGTWGAQPVAASMRAVALKAPPFPARWGRTHRDLVDLSDHYPVLGHFVFRSRHADHGTPAARAGERQ